MSVVTALADTVFAAVNVKTFDVNVEVTEAKGLPRAGQPVASETPPDAHTPAA